MNTEKIHILLADDDTDDALFFAKALNELTIEMELQVVVNGDDLMTFLKDENISIPDVLFLDINMPRKNGIDCLAEIKQIPKLKSLPIVMFSTSNEWDKINLLFKTGANVYIHKPNDFQQLKQVIFHALPISTQKTLATNDVKYILNA